MVREAVESVGGLEVIVYVNSSLVMVLVGFIIGVERWNGWGEYEVWNSIFINKLGWQSRQLKLVCRVRIRWTHLGWRTNMTRT